MSLKVFRAYPESGLDGLGASLDEDISDTIDVMPSGFTYTCGDFSPWFISFPVMVIKKFHFFWEMIITTPSTNTSSEVTIYDVFLSI